MGSTLLLLLACHCICFISFSSAFTDHLKPQYGKNVLSLQPTKTTQKATLFRVFSGDDNNILLLRQNYRLPIRQGLTTTTSKTAYSMFALQSKLGDHENIGSDNESNILEKETTRRKNDTGSTNILNVKSIVNLSTKVFFSVANIIERQVGRSGKRSILSPASEITVLQSDSSQALQIISPEKYVKSNDIELTLSRQVTSAQEVVRSIVESSTKKSNATDDIAINQTSNSSFPLDTKQLPEPDQGPQPSDDFDMSKSLRIFASGDRKLPEFLNLSSAIPDKIDAVYNAKLRSELASKRVMSYFNKQKPYEDYTTINGETKETEISETIEKDLIDILKSSLKNGGYEPLQQIDLDLCDALNVGYLLRLSILPEFDTLETIAADFNSSPNPSIIDRSDPLVEKNETQKNQRPWKRRRKADQISAKDFTRTNITQDTLFDGKVLVYRRGYCSEKTTGRLLLPKIDYLQASLVQRTSSKFTDALAEILTRITSRIDKSTGVVRDAASTNAKKVKVAIKSKGSEVANSFSSTPLLRTAFENRTDSSDLDDESKDTMEISDIKDGQTKLNKKSRDKLVKLERYGGTNIKIFDSGVSIPDSSKYDALANFIVCEIDDTESQLSSLPPPSKTKNVDAVSDIPAVQGRIHLLERVSISDIVDFFSPGGRKRLIQSLFSVSELVEPTYEELVVIWRPLPKDKAVAPSILGNLMKRQFTVPKAVYDIAEIYGIEDRLPPTPEPPPKQKPSNIEIRVFNGVQMANLPAVFPKTRLIFRPADALVFDTVSILSLLAVLASQRFDNPKFDIIAIVSVSLWLLRTVLRYSNKLARYDLLVNKFLTSKLGQRGAGAFKYLVTEGGKQRATRAALLHACLKEENRVGDKNLHIPLSDIVKNCSDGINNILYHQTENNMNSVNVDVKAALEDLKKLNLVECNPDETFIENVADDAVAISTLNKMWVDLF